MSAGSGVADEGICNVCGAFFRAADFLCDAGRLTSLICSFCRGAGASAGAVGDFVARIGFSGGFSATIGLADFSGGAILVFLSVSGDPAPCGIPCIFLCMVSGAGLKTPTPSVGISFTAAFSVTFSEGGVFTAPEDKDGGGCGRAGGQTRPSLSGPFARRALELLSEPRASLGTDQNLSPSTGDSYPAQKSAAPEGCEI
jgi:hypothetical protein